MKTEQLLLAEESGRELDGVPHLQNTAKRRDKGDDMPEIKLEVGIIEVK